MNKIYNKYTFTALLNLCLCIISYSQELPIKINGISIVSPPDSIIQNPFEEIKSLGANWTCIIPYRECKAPNFHIATEDVFSWWGLSITGIETSIQMAKKSGLKILLKPQLYLQNSWPGVINFKTEREWNEWEVEYTQFILTFLGLAIKHDVEIFCIGTEIKNSIAERQDYWVELIESMRHIYKGKIVYSANWDAYENVKFWNKLDYIGVSSYFPLSEDKNADVQILKESWMQIVRKLKRFSYRKGMKVLFTEYGYLSVDHTAYRHWEHEDNIYNLAINESAQANALDAFYSTWMKESIWAGGFLWKWYPDRKGHQGYFEKDYTPQGKKAEEVIKKWFAK